MLMQIYDENGFTDEFESKVIENMIKKSSNVSWIKKENNSDLYVLKKQDVQSMIDGLADEKAKQKEKSLFRSRSTKTLKELRIIIGILKVLQTDQVISEDDNIVMFVIKRHEEILDI